jgi:hypothetical protein
MNIKDATSSSVVDYSQIMEELKKLQERVNVLESEREEMQSYFKHMKLSVSKVLRIPKNTPEIGFKEWIHSFQLNEEHVDIVINIGTYQGFVACIEFNMKCSVSKNVHIPMIAFSHKPKYIYIFDSAVDLNNNIIGWKIMDDACFKLLVQCIWVKMIKTYLGMEKDPSVSEDIHESNQNMIAESRKIMEKKQRDLKKWIIEQVSS